MRAPFIIAFVLCKVSALTLVSPSGALTVLVDDIFPRPLQYALLGRSTLNASLVGWGHHVSLVINGGEVTCGESGLTTSYDTPGGATTAFTVAASCVRNWGGGIGAASLSLTLTGSVTAADDAVVPSAAYLDWSLDTVNASGAGAPLSIRTIDLVSVQFLSLHPAADRTACMYRPDSTEPGPVCPGDWYFADSWSNTGLDEWKEGTWSSSAVLGEASINTLAGGAAHCMSAYAASHTPGPLMSVVAGGWDAGLRVGAAVLTSQHHAPLWTGLRAYDAPGRCSVFTVAPATLLWMADCDASPPPYRVRVGIFPNLTSPGTVGPDDVLYWRRHQFPRAGLEYRATLPYKLQLDVHAYVGAGSNVISFADALHYAANLSTAIDGYPQTPMLVGWQGLGHDTAYPALDIVNEGLGGAAGLAALAAALPTASRSTVSTLSAHINTDEAYSRYNGSPNPEFNLGAVRVNVDHVTPWCSNCTITHEQDPDCGLRCSLSKTRDATSFGRAARLARFLTTFPAGLRTVHSDAWRDVGASWEPESSGGFLPWESEQRCGQVAESHAWRVAGASMGCEGENGQAAEFLGVVEYYYHGDGWDAQTWGRIVTGSSLGFDSDIYCCRPGGLCAWTDLADRYYMSARLYQLALTDELASSAGGTAHHFVAGGVVQRAHSEWRARGAPAAPMPHALAAMLRRRAATIVDTGANQPARAADPALGPPSTWPYGGDDIPVAYQGRTFTPLVMPDGTLSQTTIHAYLTGTAPDAGCPLYSPTGYLGANNTALGNWATTPLASYEMSESTSNADAARACNASCWGNSTCQAWDLIKVTPKSGHTKPLCMLFAAGVGCEADENQFAGSKAPLPVPSAATNVTWTLPLSWVGRQLQATTLTPAGEAPGPALGVVGRALALIGVTPGWPVRLVVT